MFHLSALDMDWHVSDGGPARGKTLTDGVFFSFSLAIFFLQLPFPDFLLRKGAAGSQKTSM